MRNTISFVAIALLFAIAAVVPAHAQATRTWVSGVGDDANPCSRTAPCKTFAGAISKTAAKGEINVLDPGGFGGVTITKSISIIAESVQAGVLVSGTNAIVINAGVNDVVILKGLNINGLETGLDGIKVLSAGKVFISKTFIQGFSGATSSAISIAPTLNPATVIISDVTLTKNKQGIFVNPTNPPIVNIMIDRLVAQNINGAAIRTAGGGTIRVANSVITGNVRGLQAAGTGQIISSGNNTLAGNGIDGVFDSTALLL
jgi:hypothetical protein